MSLCLRDFQGPKNGFLASVPNRVSWVCKFFSEKHSSLYFWDVGHRSGSGRGSSPFAPTQPYRKLLGPPLRNVELPANPSRFHVCQSLNDTFIAGSIAVSARIDASLSGTSRDWVALRDLENGFAESSCCPDHFGLSWFRPHVLLCDSPYFGVSPFSTGSGMRTALFLHSSASSAGQRATNSRQVS